MNSFWAWGTLLLFLGPVMSTLLEGHPDCSNVIHLAEGFECAKRKPRRLLASDWTIFFARSKEQKNDQISIRVRPDTSPLRMASSKTMSILSKLSHPSLPDSPQVFTGSGWIIRIDKGREGLTLKTFLAKKDLSVIQGLSPKLLISLSQAVDYLHSNGLVVACLTPDTIEVKQTNGTLSVYLPDLDYSVGAGQPYDMRGDWRFWDLMRYPPFAQQHTFSPKVDSYSIGVLLYVLLHQGRFPFDVKDRNTYFSRLSQGSFKIDAGIQPELAILIAELMRQEKSKRLSVSDIEVLCEEMERNKAAAVLDEGVTVNVDQELPTALWQKAHPRFARRLLEVREGDVAKARAEKEEEQTIQGSKELKNTIFWIFFGILMLGFTAYYVWKMLVSLEVIASDPESSQSTLSEPDKSDPFEGIRSMTPAERRKSEPQAFARRVPEPLVDPTSLIRIEEVTKQISAPNIPPLETIPEH